MTEDIGVFCTSIRIECGLVLCQKLRLSSRKRKDSLYSPFGMGRKTIGRRLGIGVKKLKLLRNCPGGHVIVRSYCHLLSRSLPSVQERYADDHAKVAGQMRFHADRVQGNPRSLAYLHKCLCGFSAQSSGARGISGVSFHSLHRAFASLPHPSCLQSQPDRGARQEQRAHADPQLPVLIPRLFRRE